MRLLPGDLRVSVVNDLPENPDGRFVLYWMVAARRLRDNPALDRAVRYSRQLQRPLVVFEPLRVDYPWASDRLHRFVLEGMADNAAAFRGTPIHYYPYVEPTPRAAQGLLATLAGRAAVVITDRSPMFFLPRMLSAAAGVVPGRLEAVDGNGVLPIEAADHAFPTAYAFRRFLQRSLPGITGDLREPPQEDLADLPASPEADRAWLGTVQQRWPAWNPAVSPRETCETLPIDHTVGAGTEPGGEAAAQRRLTQFLALGLHDYTTSRRHPDLDGGSHLSPYLHFGHISARDVCRRVLAHAGWSGRLPETAAGHREGWWGVEANVEAFLDELITWRELACNGAAHLPAYERYASLPAWARATLAKHADDPRAHTYDLEALDVASTHDPLWNAAQRQLVTEGRLHNVLRMLWGKKILKWSASPEQALEVMVHLNNRYAVDGRDPNSTAGIFWVLGRYDRAWGPERPVFGTVRYMTSANTARKVRVKQYLQRYGADAPLFV